MKKLTTLSVLFALIFSFTPLRAQDFFVTADLVTSFMWRGMKCNDVSFQPSAGFNARGFTFFAWGTTDLNSFESQADFFLNYKYKGFKVELANYFTTQKINGADADVNYFDFNAHSTNHMFDAVISYTISEKLPLTFSWSTIFAGADYNADHSKRYYSSYFEVAYPFVVKNFDLQAEIGFSPWEGMYTDSNKLNVVNIGLSLGKTLKITDSFSLPVFGKVVVNPAVEQTYVVFGLTL